MQKRTNQTGKIGNLFATDLFGIRSPKQPTGNGSPTAQIRKLNGQNKRQQRTILTDATDLTAVQAVYPYITTEAFGMTMNSYRQYISRYNAKVREANLEIDRYNAKVRASKLETPPNEMQIAFSSLFLKKNYGKKPKFYNELAEEFNVDRGLMIEKKRIITVKYATQCVFQQMLYLYSVQLAKQTQEYFKLGASDLRPIKKFEVNSHHITNLKHNEVFSIDVCNATIRNHRERLEECGALIDYTFRGHTKGVKMHINSEILTVYDAKSRLYVGAENQDVTSETCKDLIDNNEVTRPFKKNIKNRENAQGDFLDKGTPAAGLLSSFYKSIPPQERNSQTPAAAETVKVPQTLSEKFSAQLEHPQELAEKLAGGFFNNYTPIPIKYFEREAYSGTLTRDEFNEVVIQEFFKSAARLYRAATPFPGSWKIAINAWLEKRFKFNNGNGSHTCSKDHMVDLLKEYRWRLSNAEKWFRKTGIKTLYPSQYFDFTRLDKKEIGFEYTRRSWLAHQEYLKKKPAKEKTVKRKAAARKTAINYSKKYDFQLNRFFKNRISYDELHDYVNANLPKEYQEKLTETILKLSTKYTC